MAGKPIIAITMDIASAISRSLDCMLMLAILDIYKDSMVIVIILSSCSMDDTTSIPEITFPKRLYCLGRES